MISIIIPTLNEAAVIERGLQTCSQWPGLELIVVDGGSHDRTVEIAGRYARVLTSPPGRAVQMNAGARAARGEILWFVHADTTLPPDGPQQVGAAIAQGYLGGAFRMRFEPSTPFWDLLAWFDNQRTRLFKVYFGSRAMFVRADVFRSLGGFPEIPLMEDVAFSKLLRRAGKTVMLAAVALESFRRFQKNGPLRQLLLDIFLLAAFHLGVSPQRLADFYREIR